jgi:probable phosphoglycerate mutase
LSGQQLWLVRHGETEWSKSGQHTSKTDLPLTADGEAEARDVRGLLEREQFSLVLSSPRQRALRTAELAGFRPEVDEDLAEWDYGALEGLTTDQIQASYPGWAIWHGPWPGGETSAEVSARVDRVIARVLALPERSKVLAFAHGHILRALTARWLRLATEDGRHFILQTATLSVLSWEHDQPAVLHWNTPCPTSSRAG